MQNASSEEDRNVIPRWRSPRVADGWEISAARDLGTMPIKEADFADELALWRQEGTLAAAIDIYDTGIIIGDKRIQLEGAGPILRNSHLLPPALLDDVRRSIAPMIPLQQRRDRLTRFESSEAYLRQTVRLLKRRLLDYPRDVLALLEIARLHVLMGQAEIAERYIRRAIVLAPNDRLVLRSATQYYKLVGSLESILPALRSSDSAPYDPLIQSTEIAASDLAGKGSRFALAALKSIKGLKQVGLRRSELALAVATTERDAGLSQRRVFQLVRAGLAQSTENAQAQAVWLSEQGSRPLGFLVPDLSLADNAFEARALARFDAEDYAAAATEARAWLADQPFEIEPVNIICNCHSIYLQTPAEALPIADRAFTLHPDSWIVQNAVLLVYIGVEAYGKAEAVLANLSRLAWNPTVEAFALAGAGMLAFARGQYDAGRTFYEKAVTAARKAARPDLVFSAVAFWTLAEARSGTINQSLMKSLDDSMPVTIRRIPTQNREYASKLWKVIRSQAAKAGEERALQTCNDSSVSLEQVIRTLPDHVADT